MPPRQAIFASSKSPVVSRVAPVRPTTGHPYAVQMAEHLETGDRLPSLYGTDLQGNEVDITASVAGRWAVVLFYRGDW
jgi:hypothetical protein